MTTRPPGPSEMQKFIDETFRKEADFSKIALRYVRKTQPIFSRLTRRYYVYEPEIKHAASKLVQVAILRAFYKLDDPEFKDKYEWAADALFWYLYDSDIDEVTKAYDEYNTHELDEHVEVFCRTVWLTIGAPLNFNLRSCYYFVELKLRFLVRLFVLPLMALAHDPKKEFAEFLDLLPTEKP